MNIKMKIQINIISEESGKVRCTLQPPKPLDSFEKVKKEEDEACKVLWIKIDELLQELNKLN